MMMVRCNLWHMRPRWNESWWASCTPTVTWRTKISKEKKYEERILWIVDISQHSTTSILENTDRITTLTPIEAVVSPLAGVQRSEPGSNFRLEVWQNWGNGSTWIMSDGKHCKNKWKYRSPRRGHKRSVKVVNWKIGWPNIHASELFISECIGKKGVVTKRKHDEQQWRC